MEKLPGYNSLVRPVHFLQAVRAGMKYGWPAKKLRVIGVTGTNGKTTTAFMIWRMLNESGHKAGLLTTVGWGGVGLVDNGQISSSTDALLTHRTSSTARSATPVSSNFTHSEQGSEMDARKLHQQMEHMTTERVGVLNERMRAIADAGAEFLVLEVTSHALMQFRILGVPIEIAVFTNLTHEHLDYHKTFENYRKAKLKLFKKAKRGVVNADDASAVEFARAICSEFSVCSRGDLSPERIAASDSPVRSRRMPNTSPLRASNLSCTSSQEDKSNSDSLCTQSSVNAPGDINGSGKNACGDILTYGIEKGQVIATEVELRTDGVEYLCGDMKVKTRIPGRFNVYNSLAAVCVGKMVGLTEKEIVEGIYALDSVEGRMNRIEAGQDFEVIVDYAHTPDALEKVFASVGRDAADVERIISVHGGAGRRDESTRAERGEILGRESDIVIITEDDSRDEDPAKIAAQFVEGAEKAGKMKGETLFVELDRREAIRKAVGMARKGDLVLVLGKGHEKTILRGDGAHEFEDGKVVREEIASLSGARSI